MDASWLKRFAVVLSLTSQVLGGTVRATAHARGTGIHLRGQHVADVPPSWRDYREPAWKFAAVFPCAPAYLPAEPGLRSPERYDCDTADGTKYSVSIHPPFEKNTDFEDVFAQMKSFQETLLDGRASPGENVVFAGLHGRDLEVSGKKLNGRYRLLVSWPRAYQLVILAAPAVPIGDRDRIQRKRVGADEFECKQHYERDADGQSVDIQCGLEEHR